MGYSAPVNMTPYRQDVSSGPAYDALSQKFGYDPLQLLNTAQANYNYTSKDPVFRNLQLGSRASELEQARRNYSNSSKSMSALNSILGNYEGSSSQIKNIGSLFNKGWGANDWATYLDTLGMKKKAPPAPAPAQTQTQQQGAQNQPVNPLAQYSGQSNYFSGRPAGQPPAAFGGNPGQQQPPTGQMPVLKQEGQPSDQGGTQKSALSMALGNGQSEEEPTKAKKPAWWSGVGANPSRSGPFGF